ncbi:DnaD domain protein [Alicyclobacillus curvatus]|nr:DnaD domain protein [Alicyclobacillus curvatus]
MKPSDRESANADFLNGSFVAIPHRWITQTGAFGLTPVHTVLLLQIIAAAQVEQKDFLTPSELCERTGLGLVHVTDAINELVMGGFLAMAERLDEQGTVSTYFDLKPLWTRLRGKDPNKSPVREWAQNPVQLFEEEFGRPLSGLECEQIRQWLDRDGHPEWMINEALREAVLANKFSFKYIDRILFDWQRNRIRTKAELETYRESYRERLKARTETGAAKTESGQDTRQRDNRKNKSRDERYSAFYELFPDS